MMNRNKQVANDVVFICCSIPQPSTCSDSSPSAIVKRPWRFLEDICNKPWHDATMRQIETIANKLQHTLHSAQAAVRLSGPFFPSQPSQPPAHQCMRMSVCLTWKPWLLNNSSYLHLILLISIAVPATPRDDWAHPQTTQTAGLW